MIDTYINLEIDRYISINEDHRKIGRYQYQYRLVNYRHSEGTEIDANNVAISVEINATSG